MGTSRCLPVILPNVRDQRWSCHSCGGCCRSLVGHLFEDERKQLDQQDWTEELGVAPYVRIGRGWALNKRPDGACVFLDEQNRCRIHARFGEAAKPLACRIFPFSVRAVQGGWQASLRFDCPSVIGSQGRPIGQHRAWLTTLTARLEHTPPATGSAPLLSHGLEATTEEVDTIVRYFSKWVENEALSMADRLTGAVQVTATLDQATFKKVRGSRLAELLDLLFTAQAAEIPASLPASTARQRRLFRQLVYAHAEHVTLAQMRSGWLNRHRQRWRQVRSAGRFRRGCGLVPPLPGFDGDATFDEVESVKPPTEDPSRTANLLQRYLLARINGRTVFGAGYYGWPIVKGLAAVWLCVAAAGWLARYSSVLAGRDTLSLQDVGDALGIVDRAATRVPALGSFSERTRVAYLLRDDGVARLVNDYSVLAEPA